MSDIPRRLGGPAESRFDRAIDRAVREMMHVDPRPGFRGRVFARLDPEPVRSSSMFFRIAAGAGALAVLVLAMMVVRHYGTATVDVERVPSVADQRAAQEPQPAPPPVVTTPAAAPPVHMHRGGSRPGRRMTREMIPMPRVTNVFGSRRSAVGAASVDADAVWPTPTPEPHEDRPGTVAPLRIPGVEPPAPIVVAPLNPRGPGL